jgi:hypothetical protein
LVEAKKPVGIDAGQLVPIRLVLDDDGYGAELAVAGLR